MFKETEKQTEANGLLSCGATHLMLYGGSRSGKTFKFVRTTVIRALASPMSRHAILRFRFNHVKTSIGQDTLPKVMRLCYPELKYGKDWGIDKTDWFAWMPNDSQIWLGGLDDKDRTEKILGNEYATIYLNECSQIPYNSRNIAVTRLAQKAEYTINDQKKLLRLMMLYDCNPPSQAHWAYQVFVKKVDPDTKKALSNPANYAYMLMNPKDNLANLPPGYLETLENLPARHKLRFFDGVFAPVAENALWTLEDIEKWRELGDLPDMQRIVIAVDPSGSGDDDNADNDEIGIIAAGLGVDGNGYILEDLTCKVGPATWGNIAVQAYDRHSADCVVAEINFGGAMVEHVIQTSRKRTPFRQVRASRGKVVRAEPISALAENGKIRHAGYFHELEDELTAMTTKGYLGPRSPNRADAYVWAFSELFGQIVTGPRKKHIYKPKPVSAYAL